MSQHVFFTHANGFPSATYGKLFAALAPEYAVAHLPQHGHDPRFPVDDNWQNLVDELIHHLEQQPEPVWGVGHSLGGVLHLHAAMRCPHLYRGVVMLDSPVLTRADRWVIRAAKRFGFIDRLTPAGRTLGRREEFTDLDTARSYFAGKTLFRGFDPDCFDAYLQHGLQQVGDRLRLRFDPATEISIYRGVPHTSPAGAPVEGAAGRGAWPPEPGGDAPPCQRRRPLAHGRNAHHARGPYVPARTPSGHRCLDQDAVRSLAGP